MPPKKQFSWDLPITVATTGILFYLTVSKPAGIALFLLSAMLALAIALMRAHDRRSNSLPKEGDLKK
jgi:hypothetical protein